MSFASATIRCVIEPVHFPKHPLGVGGRCWNRFFAPGTVPELHRVNMTLAFASVNSNIGQAGCDQVPASQGRSG